MKWLPPLLSRFATVPRLPKLPTCGWFYDYAAMRRAEVLHVGGRWEKTPSDASQSPLGASVAKIDEIFPCSWLRLLLRSLVIAGLGIVEHPPRVRH